MKRFAALTLILVAVLFMALPAGANEIPDATVNVTCSEVQFGWTHFPDTPVILHITVTQAESFTAASFSTEGAFNGSGAVPVSLTAAGTVFVTFTWTSGEVDHEVNAQRELDCTPVTTTTPPTTTPPVTEPPTTIGETPTTVADVGTPVSFSPAAQTDGLANTGAGHTAVYVGAALMLLAIGLALTAGGRRGVR